MAKATKSVAFVADTEKKRGLHTFLKDRVMAPTLLCMFVLGLVRGYSILVTWAYSRSNGVVPNWGESAALLQDYLANLHESSQCAALPQSLLPLLLPF